MLAPAGEHRWGADYVRQQVTRWEHFRRGNAFLILIVALQPCLTVEIAALELEALIRHHDEFASDAERDREPETELFHKARASYLRQRLGAVALHRLTPDRAGRA